MLGLNTEKYGPEKTPYLDTFHAVDKEFLNFDGDLLIASFDVESRGVFRTVKHLMEIITKIVNGWKSLTIFTKNFILDV